MPIVDANMRELAMTGFMSNRGRQNVASFLTKDLCLDWRMGAEWFEYLLVGFGHFDVLDSRFQSNVCVNTQWADVHVVFIRKVDHDVCSNYGNWLYSAGIGNDPRENRKFNMIKQGLDYDNNVCLRKMKCLLSVGDNKAGRPSEELFLPFRVTMYASGFPSCRNSGELMCTLLGLSAPLCCHMLTCPSVRVTPPPSSWRLNGADT